MFNFGVIEGIMRFEGPIPVPKSEKGEVDSTTRKREDMEDEDLDMGLLPSYAENHLLHGYSEKDFFLCVQAYSKAANLQISMAGF